ncbi:MAG: hypothetical protein JXO72_11770, partial [Vicinamibacteria bacterium]|nr:hypothetical protein [Vicinamibacteria bacterium]
ADPPAIDAGDSSTLSWEVTNAASVEIDQGIGDVSLSGTCSVRPANTTTYTLTAHGASGDSTATTRIQVNAAPARICVPMLLTPSSGAVLDNGRTDHLDSIIWRFNWSYCAGADRYHLYVIGPSGTMPTIETDQLAVSSYQWVSDVCIPSSRLTGWTWKVRARVGGQWGDWSRSRSFRVEPPDTDPAPSSSINATISYHDYDASTGWVTFRIVNHASGAALESVEGHIINRNTSASYYGPASSNSPFRASPTQESGGVSSMSAGQTRYLRFRLSGNPAGVPCRAMIKLATAENLGGINTTKTLNFNLP